MENSSELMLLRYLRRLNQQRVEFPKIASKLRLLHNIPISARRFARGFIVQLRPGVGIEVRI